MNSSFDGFIVITNNLTVPYHFERGILKLYLGNNISPAEDTQQLIGYTITGKQTLFHLTFPLSATGISYNEDRKCIWGNVNLSVDFYVENYEHNSGFYQMKYVFDELNNMVPSTMNHCSSEDYNKVTFLQDGKIIDEFDFEYKGQQINFILKTKTNVCFGNQCKAITLTELILKFEKTEDLDFLVQLYRLVQNLFAVICNRRNVSIEKAELVSKKNIELTNDKSKQQETKIFSCKHYLFVVDNYAEEFETEENRTKTIGYRYVRGHLKELLDLIRDNKVSISSIHPNNKMKNLVDLNQSLHITAAFEFYLRTFLPEISSKTTMEFYDEIMVLMKQYASNQKGKKKRKSQDFMKGLSPVIPLDEKIKKVYSGYKGYKEIEGKKEYVEWKSLEGVLGEWFGGDVNKLARVARDWRNELAHEKNEYQPDESVIGAIRLVEHINYCINLRNANYSDDEIKEIIRQVLKR